MNTVLIGPLPGVPGVPRYGPYSATLSPDETFVVVANLEGQDVRVYDRAEKKFVADKNVPLAAKAFMPAFLDAKTILVPTQAPDGLAYGGNGRCGGVGASVAPDPEDGGQR